MKRLLSTMLLSATLLFSGCTALSVQMTPIEVKQSIARAAAVSQYATEYPPTGEDLIKFLEANADCWNSLCEYFGLELPKEMQK